MLTATDAAILSLILGDVDLKPQMEFNSRAFYGSISKAFDHQKPLTIW